MTGFLHIYTVASLLSQQYLDWNHLNKKDPLDELLFIICSTKTSEKSYQSSYLRLKKRFPTRKRLSEASASYIAKPLAGAGLQNQKSQQIQKICAEIEKEFGKLTLAPLKEKTDSECEAFLTSLPGIGKKVARCVMMYSLEREVFPVDTHCWRVSRRLGWVRPAAPDGHCTPKDMDRLQDVIPADLRYSLHVNMISLGRVTCLSQKPKCNTCCLVDICPQIGARSRKVTYSARRKRNN